MKRFFLLCGIAAALAGCGHQKGTIVERAVDGDTLKVRLEDGSSKTVRILGIDTPETVDPRKQVQCFGHEASDHMKSLATGKTVTLEAKPDEDTDKYGRLLRYVRLDGQDIGAAMIQDGYAFSYRIFPHPRLAQYNALEAQARDAKRGLWGNVCNLIRVSGSWKMKGTGF